MQRERLIQSDGAAPVGLSDLDAEIALFDAAVVLVGNPAAIGRERHRLFGAARLLCDLGKAAAIGGDTEQVATTRPLAVEHDRAVGGPRGVSERPVVSHRDHVEAARIDIRKGDCPHSGRLDPNENPALVDGPDQFSVRGPRRHW